MRQANRFFFIGLLFSIPCQSKSIELLATPLGLGLPIENQRSHMIMFDGRIHKGQPLKNKPKAIRIQICDGSLPASPISPDSEEFSPDPSFPRITGPFEWIGVSKKRQPLNAHYLVSFGNSSFLPWVQLRSPASSGFAFLNHLAFCADSSSTDRIRFRSPEIVRKPFLSLLPEANRDRGVDVSIHAYHLGENGILGHDTIRQVDSNEPSWKAIWDIDSTRTVLSSNTLEHRVVWDLQHSGKRTFVSFHNSYPREPTRIEGFRSKSTGSPFFAFEVVTHYGDGQDFDLWVVGPDTAWTTPLGSADGNGSSISTWKIDKKRGTLSMKPKRGRSRVVFQAK